MEPYQQLSFADAEYANKGKITRREKFLAQLEALLPWQAMITVIEPHYALGKGVGRKPFPLNAMLHVHVVQIVYNYSDPGMEDALQRLSRCDTSAVSAWKRCRMKARYCSFDICWKRMR